MKKGRALAGVALLAAVAACSEQPAAEAVAPLAGAASDGCGAAGFQSLLGTSVGDLDANALPEPRRVIFPGQAVTMDYRQDRLNVEIGPGDKVVRVFCG